VRVVGRLKLDKFATKHADAAPALNAWTNEALKAVWRTPADMKARYASASFLANNRVIFNIKGDRYRLDTQVAYQTQIVVIKRVGTHADYDRWTF
jgi:mRNA interferase HigB